MGPPSTHVINMTSLVKIASDSGQAEDLAHSTSYQALATDKNSPKNFDTTKLVKKLALMSRAVPLV